MTWRCALGASGFLVALVGAGAAPTLAGCARRDSSSERRGPLAVVSPEATPKHAAVPARESAESIACAGVMARLEAEPALPGAPVNGAFERAFLLGRARAEPVVFWRTPRFDAARAPSQAQALRNELREGEHPAYAFERVLVKVQKSPELARDS